MNNLEFRPCQPTDAKAAAPLIYSSGPGAFDYVFCHNHEQQALQFLQAAFVRGDSEFGYQQHVAAVYQGKVIGVGAVRDASLNFRFMFSAFKNILRFYSPLAAVGVVVRGLRTEQVIQPPKKGVGIIYQLGVAPDYRGKGVGQQILNRLLAQVRAQKLLVAALDVAESNPRAKALYQRTGFQEKTLRQGSLRSRFGHVGNHSYMELKLQLSD
jgi:ribosomal protein S18 acetylase RimI-like enzyme